MTSQERSPVAGATPVTINPAHLHDPTPNGYSTAVIAPASGRLAFVSGQGGQDRTGELSPDFAEQVKQAYENLAAVIDALGARADNVVKLTVFVVDHDMSKLTVLTETVTRMFGTRLPAQRRWFQCHGSPSTPCFSRLRLWSYWTERPAKASVYWRAPGVILQSTSLAHSGHRVRFHPLQTLGMSASKA